MKLIEGNNRHKLDKITSLKEYEFILLQSDNYFNDRMTLYREFASEEFYYLSAKEERNNDKFLIRKHLHSKVNIKFRLSETKIMNFSIKYNSSGSKNIQISKLTYPIKVNATGNLS